MKKKILTTQILLLSLIIFLSGCVQEPAANSGITTESNTKISCEQKGGIWGIMRDIPNAQPECNLPTSDAGKECSNSSECESFCEAPEGTEIDAEVVGNCYEFEFATCMQEVRNGIADAIWCE